MCRAHASFEISGKEDEVRDYIQIFRIVFLGNENQQSPELSQEISAPFAHVLKFSSFWLDNRFPHSSQQESE